MPSFTHPCRITIHRGHTISHVRKRPRSKIRPTGRHRAASRHPPQLLRPPLRLRHRRGPHLLLLPPHHSRRNHRQAAPQHRRRHLLQRPPHRLPARPFRIRPRKCQPPIRLVLLARPPFL